MEKVINLGIPHIGELIFENINTQGLIKCALVSEPWRILVENVLHKRWKGKLFQACASGKVEIVKILLERCDAPINFNTRNADGCTAFMASCKYGHKAVVQLLLDLSDANIDLNAEDKNGLNSLMWACQNGHADIAKLLLQHPEFNALEDSLNTASARSAFYNGHTDIVQLFLDYTNIKITMTLLRTNDWARWSIYVGQVKIGTFRRNYKPIIKLLLQCPKVKKSKQLINCIIEKV